MAESEAGRLGLFTSAKKRQREYIEVGLSIAEGKKRKNGAGDRDRTGDIQLGKLAFYR